MNKQEIVRKVALHSHQSQAEVDFIVRLFLQEVSEGLVNEGKVRVAGLGTFEARPRKERMRRNLQTGDPVLVPAGRAILFRPTQALRDLVNR